MESTRQAVRAEVVVVGEALVDRVIRADGSLLEAPGGSPANVAVTLGRQGRRPRLLTSLGQDGYGDRVVEWLAASGVVVGPEARNATRTATATAVLDRAGSATYEFDLDWALAGDLGVQADVVHVGSVSTILQPGADAVKWLVRSARPTATITFDPNIRPALVSDAAFVRRRVEELVGLADVVKASDEDIRWLYPERSLAEVSAEWLTRGPSLVVVTAGGQGAFGVAASGRVDCPAVKVPVVDTVGAGDTFMGTLLEGLLTAGLCGQRNRRALAAVKSPTVKDLIERSAAAAAVTVSRAGANPPWSEELEWDQPA